MNFIAAPMPANESRRQEAVERLQIKGTDQHDVMIVYSEMAQELTGFAAVAATLFDLQSTSSFLDGLSKNYQEHNYLYL